MQPLQSQNLTLDFTSRGNPGKIHITIHANHDPKHASGLDIIFPTIQHSDFQKEFFGFPVISTEIEYPISAGYGAIFGWIQLVREKRSGDVMNEFGNWEMDDYPAFADSKSPFVYFGLRPSLFDAPCRLVDENGGDIGLEWRAQSFLCVLKDVGMTRNVQVCMGGGFGWGFDIKGFENEDSGSGLREIVLSTVEVLDLEKEWNGRLALLRSVYSEWNFESFDCTA